MFTTVEALPLLPLHSYFLSSIWQKCCSTYTGEASEVLCDGIATQLRLEKRKVGTMCIASADEAGYTPFSFQVKKIFVFF